ncbi:hypothetical protein DNK59_31280 [Pseudomonas sp. TKO26]|uniref:hypothetical protein n=1 Tax=unclassified Pseudomonas TaxID=196821 RepID=UPI000DA0F395|nr:MULTISPECIES: hypothetical protein [unclassified Pseudomonas]PYY78059.1 hypothetical protein DNK62_31280 [Pseudomonas sp. TKO30]PYY78435.1 hypothetical protein DNK61_31270 [Pseudomonas sp. TKO29]PYY79984.1 hypothetical protein DNK59_31280 [Pseudomonas sp. TKO26]PYY95349.1 hypothetical protein DNK60_31270 [Pseudomonas sp. TKO14]
MLKLNVSTWLLGLLLACTTLAAAAGDALQPAQIKASGLTREQAEQVLRVALKHQDYQLQRPGVFIDGDLQDENGQPPHPGYYDFSLGYNDPKAGATEYWGLFSVSLNTGDTWEINSCKRLDGSPLRALQRRVMARTGKTLEDEKAQRQGLGCEDQP